MTLISELTGRPATDIDGTRIGVLKDLVARTIKESSHAFADAENLMHCIVAHGDALGKNVPISGKKCLPHFFGALE